MKKTKFKIAAVLAVLSIAVFANEVTLKNGSVISNELIHSVLRGNLTETERLLSQGMSPDTVNEAGDSLLMLAAGLGNEEMMRLLLEKKADVNQLNKSDQTALVFASYFNREGAVKLLLERKADRKRKDKDGYTAADWAESPKLKELLTMKKTQDISVKFSGRTARSSIGMEFVKIPVGEFLMGCSKGDRDCQSEEKPEHKVKITNPFYMGKYEVTQGQWEKVMGSNPSHFKNCGADCPVEQVSWEDVQEFIEILNSSGKETYRLPTEAEWEYAARAGTNTPRYGNLDAIAWYDKNSGGKTHPVGKKKPNAFGLYDMLGNVFEWTTDFFDENYYRSSPKLDPKGPESGSGRVLRGGTLYNDMQDVRISYRFSYDPNFRNDRRNGFRLVLMPQN